MMQTRKEYYVDYTQFGIRRTQRFLTWDAACEYARAVKGTDVIAYSKKMNVYVPGGDERMSKRIHFLKITPQYFGDVVSGDKMFEVRKDDRGFMLYDTLVLMEYADGFSGNFTVVSVQYILTSTDFPDGIKDEYCVLGLTPGQIDYERDLIPVARRANVEPCALRHPFPIRHRMVILWVH